jgi:uridine kinase
MITRIVAVDGPGGAGKSTLAGRLSAALGNAPIVHTDDFASWDNPLDWWPRLIEQVLKPLALNRDARYQRYDWTGRRLAEWHGLEPADYLILEGVSASRKAFKPYLTYSVWIDTPREDRLRRGLERDGQAMRGQWEQWMREEDAYIAREHPEETADVVVSGIRRLE